MDPIHPPQLMNIHCVSFFGKMCLPYFVLNPFSMLANVVFTSAPSTDEIITMESEWVIMQVQDDDGVMQGK